MDRFIVIGTSYRLADAQLMGAMTIEKQDIVPRLPKILEQIGARGLVYVGTCNRVELIIERNPQVNATDFRRRVFEALLDRPPLPGESDRLFRVWEGEGAIEHLFLVCSGFDSAQMGEREIYLQMRTSLKQARKAGTCSPLLDRIMIESLKVARNAHRKMLAVSNPASLAEVAVNHALKHFEGLSEPAQAMLVGVSPMTRSCFDMFDERNIPTLVINRTLESADKLVAGRCGEAISLDDFLAQPRGANAIILAVGTTDPILDERALRAIMAKNENNTPPLIIDMGIPPNVDPDVAEKIGLKRIGMDEIAEEANTSRTERLVELAPVRQVIDQGLEELRREFAERSTSQLVAGLQDQYRHTLQEAVDWLMRREMSHLSSEDRRKLYDWSATVARQCAHIPVMGIKALSAEHGLFSARTFLEASKDELLPELQASIEEIEDQALWDDVIDLEQ